ncbi:phosphate-starvation-inducible PsiE family protein [Erythrobacter sp. LQ02-29]|uniref:phosphate-starvation-inducible protein PsiE n=1 Tax=Erythrobacter sp. LQ02-29 TaxID=2920384 RepID=UPI001F4DC16F|nr:phosphate-starvation-inducible PsiE family protein [Erythrobacter sp. LQ02-29]MCP9223843.1 phosphate-starvation-inducible PsiE family protein [Erythrobacter sp. LQ02-29]
MTGDRIDALASERSEHQPDPHPDSMEYRLVTGLFRWTARILLLATGAMTFVAAAQLILYVVRSGEITLADILLMFLFTEVIAMVAVFYIGRTATFTYPILIAITALARLVVLQSKDMAPENIVFEASAILLLSIAAFVLHRGGAADGTAPRDRERP